MNAEQLLRDAETARHWHHSHPKLSDHQRQRIVERAATGFLREQCAYLECSAERRLDCALREILGPAGDAA